MKKVLLLLTIFTSVFLAVTAQQKLPFKEAADMPKPFIPSHISKKFVKQPIQGSSRSSSSTFVIDYAGMDAEVAINDAANGGFATSHLGDPLDSLDNRESSIGVNTSLPADSVGYTSYAI